MTYGSSTNPLVATDVSGDGQTVTVTLAQRDAPATMDLVPTTSTVALPAGVDVEETVTVVLGELGSVELGGKTAPAGVVWLPAQ
ncbi:hypothetical protein [Aeromicrobium sp. UC242_57]|uniref:hypothetical protein n=1 Tax=Aeromicrobium sp. UC242_57 TaxID=3374624 RepID=UPI0037BA5F5E